MALSGEDPWNETIRNRLRRGKGAMGASGKSTVIALTEIGSLNATPA